MTLMQVILIAILQGMTELFPVSSLGHGVVLPALLHWSFSTRDEMFLPLLVMLHLGTSIALLAFFWKDWLAIFRGVLGIDTGQRRVESFRILFLLIIATIPAVIIGGVFEHLLKQLFGAPQAAAAFLVVNGLMLIGVERLRERNRRRFADTHRPVASLTARDAVVIGLCQCLAFFPGISRSGATIAGGLLRGLPHDVAARFSFLMAEPVIIAATVREALKLRHTPPEPGVMHMAMIGAVVAGITGLVSTFVLMRWFREHDSWALTPFGFYCILFGGGSLMLLHLAG
ncbi:undecaprenyl-diphosphate phosphatase [Acetobacter sp. AN02]|uniref:undecaprenyl-diphosphate phosphatase n=1 Tax=Acetobacter sp. AN02 TaxID=2894186 RepID=UPI0024341383|nr:undecaprenyl-diphosphate phosphatase [Acetobacter sp. AN02]MDG6093779.1 undecaprenyl-diphosphate phosphatase [Acetobacter sp. AN02]